MRSKAADIYRGLIKRNPENHEYYTLLAEAMGIQSETEHLAMYEEYRKLFPKAQAPQRLPLNVAHGKYPKTIKNNSNIVSFLSLFPYPLSTKLIAIF